MSITSADGAHEVDVPSVGGEPVVIPIVSALIQRPDGAALLQKRAKPGEPVFGRWELPGGRWTAGQTAETVIRREVLEETGLETVRVDGVTTVSDALGTFETLSPLVVLTAADGRFPVHATVVRVHATGQPRPLIGETSDPTWMSAETLRDLLENSREGFVPISAAILDDLLASGEIV
jgi:ADP-ribose pyrophosphatase YjhB (NUDIX family)